MVKGYWEFNAALVLVLLFLLLFGLAATEVSNWPGTPEPCVERGNCYCEAPHPGGVKQPANTLSSLAFVVLGLQMLGRMGWERVCRVRARHVNPLTTDAFYQRLFAAITLCVGLGSFLFHGTLRTWGGGIDISSMFAIIGFINSYNLHRFNRVGKRGFVLMFLFITLVLGAVSVVFTIGAFLFFAFGVGTGLCELVIQLTVRHFRRSARLLVASGVTFGVAISSWFVSRDPESCNPASTFQWHAIWHVIAAVLLGLIYEHLRSEEPVAERVEAGPSRTMASAS